jgi:hypothetical protein
MKTALQYDIKPVLEMLMNYLVKTRHGKALRGRGHGRYGG